MLLRAAVVGVSTQEETCHEHPPTSFAIVYSANIMLETASIKNGAETRAIKVFAD